MASTNCNERDAALNANAVAAVGWLRDDAVVFILGAQTIEHRDGQQSSPDERVRAIPPTDGDGLATPAAHRGTAFLTALLMKTLLKVTIALVAVAVLAALFIRSARSTSAQPFTIARPHLAGWTLSLAPEANALDSLLWITPKAELMAPLGRELFARTGQSLHYPSPAMPVVLRSEFQRAIAGVLAPATLLEAARQAGLESASFQPRCMARRRISAPGLLRGVYFLLFDLPQFVQFRQQVRQRLGDAGGDGSLFDPSALSPVVIAAALDGSFSGWMPLRADPEVDCFAPIVVE
jgi:hypothetical protein